MTRDGDAETVLQQNVKASQGQGAAEAYDKALADAVRSYLEGALQSNTDSQTILNRLETSALNGAFNKMALIDASLDQTRVAYSKALVVLVAGGAGTKGIKNGSDTGSGAEFGTLMQNASESLQQLQRLLTNRSNCGRRRQWRAVERNP